MVLTVKRFFTLSRDTVYPPLATTWRKFYETCNLFYYPQVAIWLRTNLESVVTQFQTQNLPNLLGLLIKRQDEVTTIMRVLNCILVSNFKPLCPYKACSFVPTQPRDSNALSRIVGSPEDIAPIPSCSLTTPRKPRTP